MADGVVQQVAAQLAQHPGVGLDGCGVGADTEVQVGLRDQRRQIQSHLAQHLVQARHGRLSLLAQLLHLGQGQHLVGQLRGALHGVADFLQRLCRRQVAAQGRLHLDLEHRQRRAQLVRGVTHKALLMRQQARQALHHRVRGVYQRLQLAWGRGGGNGRQVVRAAALQFAAQAAHRQRGALHHQHHDGSDHGQQQGLAHQRVPQDLQRRGMAQLQRLGHLDHGHGAPLGAGHGLQERRHAHRSVAEAGVVEVHQRRVGRALGNAALPEGQLGEARDQPALQGGHAVEHAALVVGLEGLQGRVGHGGAQLGRVVVAAHVQLLADALGRGQQRAVVGRVQRRQRLVIKAVGVHADKQQRGQQDAQQQLAAQRSLPGHVSVFSR